MAVSRQRRSTQVVDKYPVVVKKAPPVKVAVCLVVLRHNDRVALVAPRERAQSPFRLEGLWELPGTRIEGEPDENAIVRGLSDALKAVGPVRKGLRAKKPLSHSITSTRYAVHVQRVDVDDPALYGNVEWVAVDDLGTKGCSSVVPARVEITFRAPHSVAASARWRERNLTHWSISTGEEGRRRFP